MGLSHGGFYSGASTRQAGSFAGTRGVEGGYGLGGTYGIAGGMSALGPMRRSFSGPEAAPAAARLPPPPPPPPPPSLMLKQQQHYHILPPPPAIMHRVEPVVVPVVVAPTVQAPRHAASSVLSPRTAVAATASGLNPQVSHRRMVVIDLDSYLTLDLSGLIG